MALNQNSKIEHEIRWPYQKHNDRTPNFLLQANGPSFNDTILQTGTDLKLQQLETDEENQKSNPKNQMIFELKS